MNVYFRNDFGFCFAYTFFCGIMHTKITSQMRIRMSKGKRKRKTLLAILLTLLLIILISFIALLMFAKPYLKAVNVAKELLNENYSYDIECYIEGITLGEGKYGEYTVYVEGEKIQNELRSYVYSEENAYLEIFANKDGEVIFNLRPFFQFISNQAEEKLNINVGELVLDIEDTYVSMRDIEEILDVDIVSPDDFGKKKDNADAEKESSKGDTDKKDSDSKKFTDKYKLKKIDEPDDINVKYQAEKSYFFQLTLLDLGTKVVVGVPASDYDEFYVNMEKGDIRLEMYARYDVEDKEEIKQIDFPKSTFTDEQIQNFKAVYKLWLAGREVLDKLKMEE